MKFAIKGLSSGGKNLGSTLFFLKIRDWLKEQNKKVTRQNIEDRFEGHLADGRVGVDSAVSLLFVINILKEENGEVTIDSPSFNDSDTDEDFQDCLVNHIHGYLQNAANYAGKEVSTNDEKNEYHLFEHVFSENWVEKDDEMISVSSRAFHPYSGIRDLLYELNFFSERNGSNYLLNNKYKRLVAPFMSWQYSPARNPKSLEDFRKEQKDKEERGEAAEKFVLDYETKRLDGKAGILQISVADVGAGFDILSFHSSSEDEPTRRIEVKSYDGSPAYFFWSPNEIEKAKEYKNDYYLYLVNRSRMEEGRDDCIRMIRNPYKEIHSEEHWSKKETKTYRFEEKLA